MLYLVLYLKEWPEMMKAASRQGDSFLHKSAGFCFLFDDYAEAMRFAGGDESLLIRLRMTQEEEQSERQQSERPRLEVIRGGKRDE